MKLPSAGKSDGDDISRDTACSAEISRILRRTRKGRSSLPSLCLLAPLGCLCRLSLTTVISLRSRDVLSLYSREILAALGGTLVQRRPFLVLRRLFASLLHSALLDPTLPSRWTHPSRLHMHVRTPRPLQTRDIIRRTQIPLSPHSNGGGGECYDRREPGCGGEHGERRMARW